MSAMKPSDKPTGAKKKVKKARITVPTASTLLRARIINSARSHFMARGLRSVTMDEIAAELGISKKTLYAHYSSKELLLQAVLAGKINEADRELSQIVARAKQEFDVTLRELLACMQRHTSEIQPALVRDIRRDAPQIFTFVEEKRRAMIQRHFGKLFKQGQKQGRVRRDIPANLILEILLGATQSVVNPAKIIELGSSPREAYAAVVSVVLYGAVVKRGRRVK